MKLKKLLIILSTVVTLGLLLSALVPAAVIQAADPYFELSDESGAAGESITVYGYDFATNYYYIYLDGTYKTKGSIDDIGEFTRSITIPSSYESGDVIEIEVFGDNSSLTGPDYDYNFDEGTSLVTFEVTDSSSSGDISIVLDPDSGASGDSVDITGSNFTPDNYYYVFFDGEYLSKYGRVDDNGEFTKTITIPDGYDEGSYKVYVCARDTSNSGPDYTDSWDEKAYDTFEITSESSSEASITLSKTSGLAGTSITITGSDFDTYIDYYVFFDKEYQVHGSTNSAGGFTKNLVIPSTTSDGEYEIGVFTSENSYTSPDYDETWNQQATATFEVAGNPAITLSVNTGIVGDTFTVSGKYLGASKTLTVYWDSATIGSTFTSDASGTFSGQTCTVPETTSGSHTVKVMNPSGTYATATFTVSPSVKLVSTNVLADSTITLSGSGFEANSAVTFYFDNAASSTVATTTNKGTLNNIAVVLPASAKAGIYTLRVSDASNNTTSTSINVKMITSTPTPTAPVNTNPAPAQTTPAVPTTSNPAQPTATAQVNNPAPTQSQTAKPPVQTNNSSGSSFPTWVIYLIVIVAVLAIVAVVTMIISRRRYL